MYWLKPNLTDISVAKPPTLENLEKLLPFDVHMSSASPPVGIWFELYLTISCVCNISVNVSVSAHVSQSLGSKNVLT